MFRYTTGVPSCAKIYVGSHKLWCLLIPSTGWNRALVDNPSTGKINTLMPEQNGYQFADNIFSLISLHQHFITLKFCSWRPISKKKIQHLVHLNYGLLPNRCQANQWWSILLTHEKLPQCSKYILCHVISVPAWEGESRVLATVTLIWFTPTPLSLVSCYMYGINIYTHISTGVCWRVLDVII